MAVAIAQPCDEGIIRAQAAVAPCAPAAAPWVLAATVLGASMVFLDGTVASVALPALQAEFGATVAELQWIVAAYTLGLAALALTGGALGDRLGRRRVFAAGVVAFALASVWCGLAQSAGQLIAARALQGVGGALLTPNSLAIVGASFGGAARGRAIGTWTGFAGIAAGLGQVAGGAVVEYASWRWAFLVNAPLALAILLVSYRFVPESRDEAAPPGIDWVGAALATLGLGAVVYGLIAAAAGGWGAAAGGSLAAGALALGAFVVAEARLPAPMLPPGLFRSRAFVGANLTTLAIYGAGIGGSFFIPLNLIQVQGYSPTAAGLALLPFVILLFALSRWTGGLVERVGARGPLVAGCLLFAAGCALFARPGIGGGYWATYFPAVVLQGLGMGLAVAPLATTVLGAVDGGHAGVASGVNNAASRLAGLLAIALLSLVVVAAFGRALDARLAPLALPVEAGRQLDAERAKLAGAEAPPGLDADARAWVERAVAEAYVAAFRLALLLCAGLALVGALVAATMIGGRAAERPPDRAVDPPPLRRGAARAGP